MKILSLGLSGAPDEIRSKLTHDCHLLVQEGFRIAIDETNKGRYTFFGCNIAEGELSFRNYERVKNMLKNCIAQTLADVIVSREEPALLRRIVDHNYHYLGEQERTRVLEAARSMLESGGEMTCGDFGRLARRNIILSRLNEYLDTHHELVLDGFVAFRLKDYRERLGEVVDKAVDRYMMDMEYQEFIRVLRYFVDVQEAQVEEVHVIIGDGETFKIRDAKGKVISNHYLESFMLRSTEDINYEDLLISALITIAPRNVMLHISGTPQEQGVVQTIQHVFEGRVMTCDGCEICENEPSAAIVPETEKK
ncbi:MAG TPA: putative sporulation protein YtxC [Selenomonadales bacterium]|nr:putative sporulation protein YtxC [Selenomonadales bacterium]